MTGLGVAVVASGGLQLVGVPVASAYSYRYCAFAFNTGGHYTDSAKCYSDSGLTQLASVYVVGIEDQANDSQSENDINGNASQFSSIAIGTPGGYGESLFQTPGFAFGTPRGPSNTVCSNIPTSNAGHDCTWGN